MKLLSLNCRGLGRPEAVQEVRSLVQLHRPVVVFLLETRRFSNDVQGLWSSLAWRPWRRAMWLTGVGLKFGTGYLG